LNNRNLFNNQITNQLQYSLKTNTGSSSVIESDVKELSHEVSQLKKMSQRLEKDLLGAKNDVGNVQESLAQVLS
jgi:seryl-tRNA synthetase